MAGLLATLLLAAGPIPGSIHAPKAGENGEAQSHTPAATHQDHTEANTDRAPQRVILLNADEIEHKAAQYQREEQEKSPPDWWARVGVIAAVIIGLLQTAVFGYQALKLRQTVKDSQEGIKAATDAATAAARSAKAAEESIAQADTHARQELRAYVHLHSAQVFNIDEPEQRFVIVEMQNYGKTPALDVEYWIGEHAREWPTQSAFDDAPQTLSKGKEPLAPGRGSIMHIHVGLLSESEENAFQQGFFGIYAWGKVTYRDIFGQQYMTRFRLVCEGRGLDKGAMHACADGNEAD